MNLSTFITTHLLVFILLLACVSAEGSGSSSSTKLQISSQDALCSMPYGDFRINIYEHPINHKSTTIPSRKRYFYSPLALLDHMSADSKYGNVTRQAEMRFRIEIWNENVQGQVVDYLSDFIGQQIKSNQVQIIPFEKLVLTNTKKEPSTVYSLPTDWHPYHLEKSLWFSLICSNQKDCNHLKDVMHEDPTEFRHLKLIFSLSSKTSQTKQIIIGSEHILSNQMVGKLLNYCNDDEYALITVEEKIRLLSELTTNVIMEYFDDSEVISPRSQSQIYRTLKGLLVNSAVTITKENYNLEEPVCWNDNNNQTDKKLIADSDIVTVNESSMSVDNSTKTTINGSVESDGNKWISKTITMIKINLRKLRSMQSIDNIPVKVRYSTAVLSTFVHFVPFAKLSTTDEWADLKKELKELKNEHQNLKIKHELDHQNANESLSALDSKHQLLNSDYQNLKIDHQRLKIDMEIVSKTHAHDLQSTNTKFSVLRKELEDSVTLDISFSAYRNDPLTSTNKYVPYEVVGLNNGNGLDATTGIFTAPKAGTYLFTFHAEMDPREDQWVFMKLNGQTKTRIFNEDNTTGNSIQRTSAMSIILSLNANDKVGVYLQAGTLRQYSYFSGVLVREYK